MDSVTCSDWQSWGSQAIYSDPRSFLPRPCVISEPGTKRFPYHQHSPASDPGRVTDISDSVPEETLMDDICQVFKDCSLPRTAVMSPETLLSWPRSSGKPARLCDITLLQRGRNSLYPPSSGSRFLRTIKPSDLSSIVHITNKITILSTVQSSSAHVLRTTWEAKKTAWPLAFRGLGSCFYQGPTRHLTPESSRQCPASQAWAPGVHSSSPCRGSSVGTWHVHISPW